MVSSGDWKMIGAPRERTMIGAASSAITLMPARPRRRLVAAVLT
jgi:hypothetical protein